MIGAFTLSVGSDGLIYAASDDRQLYVVDSFGCQVASFEGQNWLSFPVITDDSELIVADANSIVYCLSAVCDGNTQSLRRTEDVSRDSQINFTDFALLAENRLGSIDSPSPYVYIGLEYYLPGDIDRNGYVDTKDLYLLSVEGLKYCKRPVKNIVINMYGKKPRSSGCAVRNRL
jgi:hypothetical protein